MLRLFDQFILRDLFKNRLRFLITILGIALGVGVLLSINLANNTVNSQFSHTVDQISGKANLEIEPGTSEYINEATLRSVSWISRAGGKATALIQKYVLFADSTGELVEFLGIDMLGDQDFRSYASDDPMSNDIEILEPNSVFIGEKLAKKHHLKAGQSFSILVDDAIKHLKVVQVLSGKGLGGAYSGNLIVGDLAVAQEILNLSGKISSIELIIPPQSLQETRQKLINEMPKTLSIESPHQRTEQLEKITQSFEYNLLALSFVALMVGMFLIYNTMSITVLRRKQEIGILRAIGLKRVQIFVLFSLEVFLIGLLGSGLGLICGLFLSNSSLQLISQTIQYFYYQEPIGILNVDNYVLAGTFLGGILITFLSSLPPLIEASCVTPAEVVRRSSQTVRLFSNTRNFAFIGSSLLLLAFLSSLQPAFNHFPIFGYIAAFLSIVGLAFCLPLSLQIILPRTAKIMTKFNFVEGKLAALSLYGTLDRTAVAVASLMLGIAMMVSLATMIGSFRNTVNTWIEQTLKADLWVESSARAGGSKNSHLSDKALAIISKITEIEAVDTFVEIPILYRAEKTNLAAADFSVVEKHGHLSFVSGGSCATICSRLRSNSALISETFAIRKNVKQGDMIEIETPSGKQNLRVEAIYYDYASDLGYILIDRKCFIKLFHSNDVSSCAIYLKAGTDRDFVRSKILKSLHDKYLVSVRSTGELRSEAMKIFDRTFAITYALHTIAIVVAILAVMNALFALTIESKREFGILRYLGASAVQIKKLILCEASLLGIFGNIAGIILGFVLSVLLIYVINRQSFGWTIKVSIPYAFLLQSISLVFITAILSGLIPAQFAAKTVAPQVVRDE